MLAMAVAAPEPVQLVRLVRLRPRAVSVAQVSLTERSRELRMAVAVVPTERIQFKPLAVQPVASAEAGLVGAAQPQLRLILRLLLEPPAPAVAEVATVANVQSLQQPLA
jgi:hypothetical protein